MVIDLEAEFRVRWYKVAILSLLKGHKQRKSQWTADVVAVPIVWRKYLRQYNYYQERICRQGQS